MCVSDHMGLQNRDTWAYIFGRPKSGFYLFCQYLSGSGLGAILYQERDGKERLHMLHEDCPKLRGTIQLTSLSSWPLSGLLPRNITIIYMEINVPSIYNNPITYVLAKAIAALCAHHVDIKYRPGKSNSDADALSRMPQNTHENDQYVRKYQVDSIRAL